jgi:hypothetical protein
VAPLRQLLTITVTLLALATGAAQRFDPFVPVGVWYDGLALAPSAVLHDVQTIRALGFNHITVPVAWAAIEPERGKYVFERLDQFLTLAGESGLKVGLRPNAVSTPSWADARSPDPQLVGAFIDAVMARVAGHQSSHASDLGMLSFPLSISQLAAASIAPAQRMWRLDAVRSTAGERGWIAELEVPSGTTPADVRYAGWAAIAHGARGITFLPWSAVPPQEGLLKSDGTITAAAEAAGEFAGIVSRNAALFAPLRPRRSPVAVVYNPFWSLVNIAADAVAQRAFLDMHARAFERNLQPDFISSEEIAPVTAAAYAATLVPFPAMLPPQVAAALKPSADAGDRLLAGPRTPLPTARGLEPDIRVDGGAGLVQARFLESADAIGLIALNHDERSRTVTFQFSAETPEAIWQNMETGASVSFVQGAGGLTYTHTFQPRGTIVLAIRKRLR